MTTAIQEAPPATTKQSHPRMTAEEFFAKHEKDRVELVRGIVKEMPMPDALHGFICSQIARYLANFAEAEQLGRVMCNDSFVKFPEDSVLGPDVFFISYTKLPKGKIPRGLLEIIPELVVEIRSPSDLWTEIISKTLDYLAAGVTAVMVVNPEREAVAVYRSAMEEQHFSIDQELALPDVLPGFSLPVRKLFE
jgi:Uma2 family endonuclease